MFTLKADFIGDFKTGDNINRNLKILALLYRYYESADSYDKGLLNKPITLILVSIIEAVLQDFHGRIVGFTSEGVQSLASTVIAYIRGKDIDEFSQIIDSAKKHDLLNSKNPDFYDKLHLLRRIRNRFHIQNTKHDLEKNESDVFTSERKILAEQLLEQTLKIMAEKYTRQGFNVQGHVSDFVLPWAEHIKPPPTTPSSEYLDFYEEYCGLSYEELRLLGFL